MPIGTAPIVSVTDGTPLPSAAKNWQYTRQQTASFQETPLQQRQSQFGFAIATVHSEPRTGAGSSLHKTTKHQDKISPACHISLKGKAVQA
tara:strand:+ start:690 stop:962 length:273 start_codon:yes stop_codon:yes gene_type:complete